MSAAIFSGHEAKLWAASMFCSILPKRMSPGAFHEANHLKVQTRQLFGPRSQRPSGTSARTAGPHVYIYIYYCDRVAFTSQSGAWSASRSEVRAARMLSIEPGDERFRWLFERLWSLARAAEPESTLWELEPLNLVSLLDLETILLVSFVLRLRGNLAAGSVCGTNLVQFLAARAL